MEWAKFANKKYYAFLIPKNRLNRKIHTTFLVEEFFFHFIIRSMHFWCWPRTNSIELVPSHTKKRNIYCFLIFKLCMHFDCLHSKIATCDRKFIDCKILIQFSQIWLYNCIVLYMNESPSTFHQRKIISCLISQMWASFSYLSIIECLCHKLFFLMKICDKHLPYSK